MRTILFLGVLVLADIANALGAIWYGHQLYPIAGIALVICLFADTIDWLTNLINFFDEPHR